MDDREQSVQHFLDLIKRSHRGKFKIYIGMIAGMWCSHCQPLLRKTSIGCMLRYTVKISNSRRWWPKAGERYRYIIHLIGSGEE